MGTSLRRLCILLAVCLAAAVLVPAFATAGTAPRPQLYVKDAYEPDDTSATAKALPTVSHHTLSNPGTSTPDLDWSVVTVSAAESGTPLFFDFSPRTGFVTGMATYYKADPAQPSGLATTYPIPSMAWGGIGNPTTYLQRVPAGTYYISLKNLFGGAGSYVLTEKKGALSLRVSGPDRYSTAVAVSKQMWPNADGEYEKLVVALGGGTEKFMAPAGCIIATGRNFADALAASAWINVPTLPEDRMPILLTDTNTLPSVTAEEILRLASLRLSSNSAFKVYIVGGTPAVSASVEASIAALNATGDASQPISEIVRLAGPTRFDTAVAIAQKEASSTAGIGDTVFVVNGFSFADALSAGPVAGASKAPLLLVNKDSVPAATAAFLAANPAIDKAVLVGSESVVSSAVASALAAPPYSLTTVRVSGPTRYETSRQLASYGATHGVIPFQCTLATGADFPDGLSAAGLSAFQRSPLLLTPGNTLASSVASYYASYPFVMPSFIVGGPPAISTGVEAGFNDLWRTKAP